MPGRTEEDGRGERGWDGTDVVCLFFSFQGWDCRYIYLLGAFVFFMRWSLHFVVDSFGGHGI